MVQGHMAGQWQAGMETELCSAHFSIPPSWRVALKGFFQISNAMILRVWGKLCLVSASKILHNLH